MQPICRRANTIFTSFTRAYRCAILNEYKTPLQVQDVKHRDPGDHEILISTEFAGVNHADGCMLKGEYHLKPVVPFVPGFEAIGTITAAGKNVKNFNEGERVVVFKTGGVGGFSQRTIADEKTDIIVKLPFSIDAEVTPSLSAYCLAYVGMKRLVMENLGNSFLVLSARGTVGYAALDLAQNVFEGLVFGASDSEEKLSVLREANVNSTFNWTDGELARNVKHKTFGKGVDFVIDTVGGDVFDQGLQCLKEGGHYLSLGFSSGVFPKVNLLDLHRLNASISGVWLSGRNRNEIKQAMDMVIKLFDDDFLSGIKIHQYKLEDINQAFEDSQKPDFFGKAVITLYD
uniref:Enoyl reductase (ER) domain-containing protein n=1 Tax=Panagrellus redivivus TaxID=6233 RepID=A0A7E4UM85_PANRE